MRKFGAMCCVLSITCLQIIHRFFFLAQTRALYYIHALQGLSSEDVATLVRLYVITGKEPKHNTA